MYEWFCLHDSRLLLNILTIVAPLNVQYVDICLQIGGREASETQRHFNSADAVLSYSKVFSKSNGFQQDLIDTSGG